MAKKIQPKQGETSKTIKPHRRSDPGDSKGSMDNLRKAMEIPPKTGKGGKNNK